MSSHEPVVDYVRRIVSEAVLQRASDIHFEPYDSHFRIRYRIDGKLIEVHALPLPAPERLVSCLKVMARLDIAEKRLPQDGRIGFPLPGGERQDLRLSTLPTVHGEKIVLRLMAPAQVLGLEQLGMEPEQLELFRLRLAHPHGLVLIAGPTGSGKSATLYASLLSMDRLALNICTVEDPVEVALASVNQVAVNDKAGLGFALALRALLRQDPDVIMIGEMRDALTADIAVKAAQTGHLVLSSVHTQSAQASLARLVNMGVTPFNLASALNLIISQRLVRRLCPQCRREQTVSVTLLQRLGWRGIIPPEARCFEARGCPHCSGSGYLGRVGLFELLPLDEETLDTLRECGVPRLARQASPDLRRAGLNKALAGETTLAEVAACTPE
jgi:type IV pilus assembly protein PilB